MQLNRPIPNYEHLHNGITYFVHKASMPINKFWWHDSLIIVNYFDLILQKWKIHETQTIFPLFFLTLTFQCFCFPFFNKSMKGWDETHSTNIQNLNKNSDNNFLKPNESGGPEAKTKACLVAVSTNRWQDGIY